MRLERHYAKLEESRAKSILVITDACFSGSGGRTPRLAKRCVAIKPVTRQNRAIIFSSSSDTEPSGDFEKVQHGYFSYYFFLGLKGYADTNNDGIIELDELFQFVQRNVREETQGRQTPECLNKTTSRSGGINEENIYRLFLFFFSFSIADM